jgi:hypothetical protein
MHRQHKLGRIITAEISLGGPYNSELGLLVTLGASQHNGQESSSWVSTSFDGVRHNYMRGDEETVASLVYYLGHILQKADVTKINELVHKPVMCEFEGDNLVSWTVWGHTI